MKQRGPEDRDHPVSTLCSIYIETNPLCRVLCITYIQSINIVSILAQKPKTWDVPLGDSLKVQKPLVYWSNLFTPWARCARGGRVEQTVPDTGFTKTFKQ